MLCRGFATRVWEGHELSSLLFSRKRRHPTTKHQKDQRWAHPGPILPHPLAPLNISYKGKLIGQLPSAYEMAFNLLDHMQEDADSDVEEEDLCEGFASISLSKDEKVRIRAQWSHALIIKTFGRAVGYQYLSQRVREIWKPSGNMDLVYLGHYYFFAQF